MAEHVIETIHVGDDDYLIEVVGETTERWPLPGNREWLPSDFPGQIVGFNWSARDTVTRDEVIVSIRVNRASITLPARSGTAGQIRWDELDRGDRADYAIIVERRWGADRMPGRTR